MSIAARRKRLVVLLTACALIACTAVFAAHEMGERAPAHARCDLCSHFAGSAGSPAAARVAGKPVLVASVVPPRAGVALIARSARAA
ncbi:MAG TPA: hypothetical protein VET66_04960 [Steroidobacteraceae bacterium]|nr:hypothetical protein [Steroidobacteraceae bacterium]